MLFRSHPQQPTTTNNNQQQPTTTNNTNNNQQQPTATNNNQQHPGSSNTDINLSLGSIFAIRQQEGTDLDGEAKDLLNHGRKQLAAGYILYGPSTMLVYGIGKGVHFFTLDPSLGEFILTEENVKIPQHGPVYSVNEGNFWQWEEPFREYIRYVHRTEGYTARYSGAMVSDIHRILVQGGVFLYPVS